MQNYLIKLPYQNFAFRINITSTEVHGDTVKIRFVLVASLGLARLSGALKPSLECARLSLLSVASWHHSQYLPRVHIYSYPAPRGADRSPSTWPHLPLQPS